MKKQERTLLTIFARLPERGRVKTRIAAARGEDFALQLHCALLSDTIETANRWQAAAPAARAVRLAVAGLVVAAAVSGAVSAEQRTGALSGSDPGRDRRTRESAAMRMRSERTRGRLRESLAVTEIPPVVAQAAGELGTRMHKALHDALSGGFDRALLIGCDAPLLTPDHLDAAETALDDAKLVLGPAEDGGYWLIGTRVRLPEFLARVKYGTDTALADTIAEAGKHKLKAALTARLYDVDYASDVERARTDLKILPPGSPTAVHLRTLLGS